MAWLGGPALAEALADWPMPSLPLLLGVAEPIEKAKYREFVYMLWGRDMRGMVMAMAEHGESHLDKTLLQIIHLIRHISQLPMKHCGITEKEEQHTFLFLPSILRQVSNLELCII